VKGIAGRVASADPRSQLRHVDARRVSDPLRELEADEVSAFLEADQVTAGDTDARCERFLGEAHPFADGLDAAAERFVRGSDSRHEVTQIVTHDVPCQASSLSENPGNCDTSQCPVTRQTPPPEGTRGRLLFDARQKLGLSQREVAKRVGTSRRRYMDWEHNKHRPGADYSEALALELKLPVEKVLDPELAHVRRNQDKRVTRLLAEAAALRKELKDCRDENRELQRMVARLAS